MPAIETRVKWKKGRSGGGPPSSFSRSLGALGHWIWKRKVLRGLWGSATDHSLRSKETAAPLVAAWNWTQLRTEGRPTSWNVPSSR